MNSEIIFNEDHDSKSIFIMKIYNTDVSKLWEYFTKSELLDLWWAPQPWKCETKQLDFREGGTWIYSMNGPEGDKMFSLVKFGEINDRRSFEGIDAFCDENGNVDSNFPQTHWLLGFTGVEDGTKLSVNMHFKTQEDMNTQLEMGFEQGFKMGLNQLEDLLNNIYRI